MPRDTCLLLLVFCVCALAQRSVLERAKEIGSSVEVLPSEEDADAELEEPWPDTKLDERVPEAFWDLEDRIYFSKDKRDLAAGVEELLRVFIELEDALPGPDQAPWLTGLDRDEVHYPCLSACCASVQL